jgi:hypothetical protein
LAWRMGIEARERSAGVDCIARIKTLLDERMN